MKTDRTTKLLLGLIALALWAHVLAPFVQPRMAEAQTGKVRWEIGFASGPEVVGSDAYQKGLKQMENDGWEPFQVRENGTVLFKRSK